MLNSWSNWAQGITNSRHERERERYSHLLINSFKGTGLDFRRDQKLSLISHFVNGLCIYRTNELINCIREYRFQVTWNRDFDRKIQIYLTNTVYIHIQCCGQLQKCKSSYFREVKFSQVCSI